MKYPFTINTPYSFDISLRKPFIYYIMPIWFFSKSDIGTRFALEFAALYSN